jgi:hypothetical protein
MAMRPELKELNFTDLLNDGWKLAGAELPSVGSFKWVIVILKDQFSSAGRAVIQQAAWEPRNNYSEGSFYQPLKIGGSVNPVHGECLDDKVLLWKPIDDLLLPYIKKEDL